MKIRFILTGFEFFPDYFTKLLGVVHKWIGENDVHDNISLYTFSHIRNNSFTFVCFDKELLNKIKKNAMLDKEMFRNTRLRSVQLLSIKTNKEIFSCASPFFVKENDKHLIYKNAEKRAKQILLSKAKFANIDLGDFELEFLNFRKTKLIKIHDINNKCYISDVKITGNKQVKEFACKVGIGSSTGVGFGFIY